MKCNLVPYLQKYLSLSRDRKGGIFLSPNLLWIDKHWPKKLDEIVRNRNVIESLKTGRSHGSRTDLVKKLLCTRDRKMTGLGRRKGRLS